MRHVQTITRPPAPAQTGSTNIFEVIIEALLAVYFRNWDNFQAVYQGLSKYFSKTP